MISPERLEALQGQWVRLVQPLNVELVPAYAVFDRLVAAYSEAHRYYHTLEHLGELFRVASRLPATDRVSLNLAIWFHDAVYDPTRSDNELRSAEVAKDWLTELGLDRSLLDTVGQLIEATAHHDSSPPHLPDAVTLRDADLAILGAAERRYLRYAADIRREYAHLPEPEYRTGRAAVLRGFLDRPRIYHHQLLQEEGEAAARRNLESELLRLI